MLMDPVGMLSMTATASFWPSRMIEPLPNCFSIWPMAISIARARSLLSSAMLPLKTDPTLTDPAPSGMSRPAYERGIEGVKRKSLDVWLQIVRCEQLTDVATFAMWLTQG